MELVTGTEMKRIDQYTCMNLTPSIELMERAGKGMAEIIRKKYPECRILLLCGTSGNGGDAFVAGRYLLDEGYMVDAYISGSKLSKDCTANKELFKGNIYDTLPLLDYDLIIDGLIGFGLKSTLRDNYIEVIHKVNDSKIPVVSLDIPTGIDADSGISYGAFIRSDLCITVEYPKTGLYLNDGLDSFKELEVVHVGIIAPSFSVHKNEISDFKGMYKERRRNSNKGSYGKAACIAGSYKYPGASLISYTALSQFKLGCGYSMLYIPEELYPIYALRHPELIVSTLPSTDGHIKYDEEALSKLLGLNSIAIGMGMDISLDLYKSLEYLIKNYTHTLIIDADALNTLGKYGMDILLDKKCDIILTPHIKEMERISGILTKDILSDPIDTAKSFALKYKVTLILKSASSVITDGAKVSVSDFGCTGLAKGGSGDMLSGILSGVASYLRMDTYSTACMGAYILGRASEFASESVEEEAMGPMDVIGHITDVIKEIKND